jgi:hypothetical protein
MIPFCETPVAAVVMLSAYFAKLLEVKYSGSILYVYE